jgi:hypothetical protein
LESANHITGHLSSGIATLSLFLSPTTHIAFHDASDANKEATRLPLTTHTAGLMEHDFRRFLAVADFESNVRECLVSFNQGVVFIFTLVASQVLARGSRSTIDDLLQWQVTKEEFGAVACAGVNILVVLFVGSLKGNELNIMNLIALTSAVTCIGFAQFACLYKLCRDIATGNHEFHHVRAPRFSAVVPQAPGAVAGETGTTPPVTPLPAVVPDDLLAMVEGLERAIEAQREGMEAKFEKQANLSKALGEQVASLSVALEEQRQKTEHLEAHIMCQTEIRRVAL